jgi:hypothetical protein
LTVGIVVAVLTLLAAFRLPRSRRSLLFSLLLVAAAGVYVGGALSVRGWTLALEAVAFVAFGIAAFSGVRNPVILGLVWPLHALWDLLHHLDFLPTPIARWYRVACFAADVVWGFVILGWPRLFLPKRSSAEHPAPEPPAA